jgi:hypothetical protein
VVRAGLRSAACCSSVARKALSSVVDLGYAVVPADVCVRHELIGDPDCEKSQRMMAAMLKMKKIEIAELERAAAAA